MMLDILKTKKAMVGLASVTSLVVGATLGYVTATRKLTAEFDLELTKQIELAKEAYKRVPITQEFDSPEEALAARISKADVVVLEETIVENKDKPDLKAAATAALRDYHGIGRTNYNKVPPLEDVVEISKNVFTNARSIREWDDEVEAELRDPDRPYVVSYDEYHGPETEHDQISLTWYAGDSTLADDQDMPINPTDLEERVGADNLARFGHGSGDENIVYIRNVATSTDYEVAYSEGKFSRQVLGFDLEEEDDEDEVLQHTNQPLRKFRPERDD